MYAVVVLWFALLTIWGNAWTAFAPHRIVDLTHIFDNTTLSFPGVRGFEMNSSIAEILCVRVQLEQYSSPTHVGTHTDAPCFHVPGRKTVAEIPLDRLVAPAAVVDIRDKVASNPDYELQIDDLLDWEHTTDIFLNDVILLVRSGWSQYWSCNATAYFGTNDNDPRNLHYPGISPSAAMWLVKNRNVYGVLVEALGVDYGPSQRFPTENILYGNNIYGVINVGDMSELPLFGSTVYVMPMKIGGACGAPTRVFATFPENPPLDYRLGHSKNMILSKRKSPPGE